MQTETITRWAALTVENQNCESETRSRTRRNNGAWEEWTGSFAEEQCTEAQTRTRWASTAAGAGECLPQTQRRSRVNNGAWSEWSGSYTYEECTETEIKLAWREAYIAGACVSEIQMRTNVNHSPWSDWIGPQSYVFDTCTEVQFRTRYENEFEIDQCVSEDQSRQRVNNAPWPDVDEQGQVGGWSGIYSYAECIQLEGVQQETRIMYRESAAYAPETCEFEMQTRSRAGGADWSKSPWVGLDPTRSAWEFQLCREYDSQLTWKAELCDGSVGGCDVCESQVERRSRALGENWPECKSSRYCWHLGCILPRVPAISLRTGRRARVPWRPARARTAACGQTGTRTFRRPLKAASMSRP